MRPNKNTVDPVISEKFSGMIWKVKVHKSGVLGLETRNADLKQVAFSAYNFITGKVYFKERSFEENWNLSLAFAGEHSLVLNRYEHAETPESKGVISVKTEDGSVRWQKFNISLNRVRSEGLEVYDSRLQPRKYSWLDHISGNTMSAPDDDDPSESVFFPEIDNSLDIPVFIQHGALVGELQTLTYSEKMFLSFHEATDKSLQQRLIVYQGDSILIDDILIAGIQKLQPEAFFIQQNHLFYIRNKNEIITYLI